MPELIEALVPSTLGGMSALFLSVGMFVLLIFKNVFVACACALVGGIGLSGQYGEFVEGLVERGASTTQKVTAYLFGYGVGAVFFILLVMLLFRWAFGKGGGGSSGGFGKGVGGKGLGGKGSGKGGRAGRLLRNAFLFTVASAVGATLGTISWVSDGASQAVTAVHSAATDFGR